MGRIKQIFDPELFDGPLVFDTEDAGHFIRNRRKRRKVIDYEHAIMKNVRR